MGLLEEERKKIKQWHRSGAGGREVVQAHTGLIDETIKYVITTLANLSDVKNKTLLDKFALVAVGGYGRGELNPCSDIDLLFLYQGKLDKALDSFIQDSISVLWGINLEIGHSCRTVKDCQNMALQDTTIRTSMVEMRLLIGNINLYKKLWGAIRKNVFKKNSFNFLNGQLKDFLARKEAKEGVTSQLEPDIKNGPGGLRDYHLTQWAVAIRFEGQSYSELNRQDIISSKELDALEKSVDFLLRVRNELHYLKNKKADKLDLDVQKLLAKNLNYKEPNESARAEFFMRDYYSHATSIRQIADDVFNRCLEAKPLIKSVISNLRQKKLSNGFSIRQSQLTLIENEKFLLGKDKDLFLEVFQYCQEYNIKPSSQLKRIIRENLALIDSDFLQKESVGNYFMGLLEIPDSEKILRLMHEIGVLGRLLPEFEQILFQVNYDYYHRYTTDEHSLRMVKFLEQIPLLEEENLGRIKTIYIENKELPILKLACLLHALGEKRQTRKQTIKSALKRVIIDLKINENQRKSLVFLIENLNTMNEISFHKDIHEQSTIKNFGELVESVDQLNLLLLISYAELKAVAPDTWTAWKKILLLELYHRTRNFLVRPESLEDKPNATRSAVISSLRKEIPQEMIIEHFNLMPEDYLQIADSKNVIDHIRLINQLKEQPFVFKTQYNESGNFYDLILCCPSNINVVKNLIGVLTAKALNILGAQIFSRKDNLAVIILQIEGEQATQIHGDADKVWKVVQEDFMALVEKRITLNTLLKGRTRLINEDNSKAPILPRIQTDNFPDNSYTFIRIEAKDHPGMLYKIVHSLAKFGIELHRAKISTKGGRGIDVFSVSLRNEKISFQPLLRKLRESLINSLLVERLEDLY